jgi:hypothetical protein
MIAVDLGGGREERAIVNLDRAWLTFPLLKHVVHV